MTLWARKSDFEAHLEGWDVTVVEQSDTVKFVCKPPKNEVISLESTEFKYALEYLRGVGAKDVELELSSDPEVRCIVDREKLPEGYTK